MSTEDPAPTLPQTPLLASGLLTRVSERIHTLFVHEQNLQRELLLEQARQQRERARVEEANALAAQEKIKAEQERLRAEQVAREEQERLREIATKKIPPLPPVPTPKPEQQAAAQQPQAARQAPAAAPALPANANLRPPAQSTPQPFSQAKPTAAVAVNGIATLKPPASNTTAGPIPGASSAPAPHDAKRQRAVEIHKNLKRLRAAIASQSLQNKPLKSRAGDLRRELRKVIGQLSLDRGGNKVVVSAYLPFPVEVA